VRSGRNLGGGELASWPDRDPYVLPLGLSWEKVKGPPRGGAAIENPARGYGSGKWIRQ
jgi:hypothetical protein